MELTNYVLASFIVSLGLFCGAGIGYATKEELRPGKRYFVLLQNIIIGIMLVLFVYFKSCAYIAVVAAFLFFLSLDTTKIIRAPKIWFYYFAYAVFALLFFESSRTGMIPVQASLIFLYGLPTGSVIFMKKGWFRNILMIALIFFGLCFLLFFSPLFPGYL